MQRGRNRREEKVLAIQEQLEAHPWDVLAWDDLVLEFQARPTPANIAEKRAVYEQVLARFPTAAHYWQQYAEAEMQLGNDDNVRAIFGRCLLSCLDVDLWSAYVRFVRKVNDVRDGNTAVEVKQAFDFTLDKLGQDHHAGQLWSDYLTFLQGPKPGTPAFQALFAVASAPGQEEAHRVAVIRAVFQRAIMVPTQQLEQIWRSYESFEMSNTTNKTLARKILDEQKPKYQAARAVTVPRRKLLDDIDRRALAVPIEHCSEGLLRQAAMWRACIAYERTNPQRLMHQDLAVLHARIALAFEQALMALHHFPEMWLEYAEWHLSLGPSGQAAALAVLSRAQTAIPQCLAVHFAAADVQEASGQPQEAAKVYEALLPPPPAAAEGEAPASKVALTAEQQALVWIQYMRFVRRSEGRDKSRKAFLRARKSDCGWQVVVASALMEWTGERAESIARNIFEQVGMAKFAGEPGFVAAYVDFLTGLGDVTNARAAFERALTSDATPSDDAAERPPEVIARRRELWGAYVAFEHAHGDCASWQAVERRRGEDLGAAVGEADAAVLALSKYRCGGLVPFTAAQAHHVQAVGGPGAAARLASPRAPRARSPPPPFGGDRPPPPRREPAGSPLPERGPPRGGSALGDGMPPAVASLLAALPPARVYDGPLMDVEAVMDAIMQWEGGNEGGAKRGLDADVEGPGVDVFKARKRRAGRFSGLAD